MFVAASTDCFASLPLDSAIQRLVDLEYSRVEIAIRENGNQIKPSQVHADLEGAIHKCRDAHRMTPVAYSVDMEEGPHYYEYFASCCKLAKATKVVALTVRASELGTPFNAEVERLRELTRIATLESVVVGLKTEIGRMSQDPATAAVLCDNVKGLCITLDPSHYVHGPLAGVNYDNLIRYTCHTQLRDSNKNKLQVRIGQGEIEYGRLVSQLSKVKYNRALCVNIDEVDDPEIDHQAEMRKMRLLLESLL